MTYSWAGGIFLILYKGYSATEDYVLNAAGACAILTALIPKRPGGITAPYLTAHGFFSISLFLCMAYVSVFCAKQTLGELQNQGLAKLFRYGYCFLGIAMVLVPGSAYLLTVLADERSHYVIVAESGALLVFGSYWVVKTVELYISGIEEKGRVLHIAPESILPAITREELG